MQHAVKWFGIVWCFFASAAFAQESQPFDRWLEQMRAQAIAEGVSSKTLDAAFDGLTPDERVIRLDRKQPESRISLGQYLKNTVNPRREARARARLAEHAATLSRIARARGVPAAYMVALWGIESEFGDLQGNFSVIRSLATLAYEGRRREFFTRELVAALKIIEQEGIPPEALTGSWAGAMGQCQFMPSTYLAHAADGDGDGTRDIWHSEADVFASIAAYLQSLGWKAELPWGVKASFPAGFTEAQADITQTRTVAQWKKQGIRATGLPGHAEVSAIYAGDPHQGGMALLVTSNYKALLQWNRSRYFATAVGTLATRLSTPASGE